jgi:hypothetical protein
MTGMNSRMVPLPRGMATAAELGEYYIRITTNREVNMQYGVTFSLNTSKLHNTKRFSFVHSMVLVLEPRRIMMLIW